ncbi:MAG: succinylglutamate desuccinylase/aspartoacylase family protein [bacterium]|nr:succinylglutamate desuccinylase/aspartoacylase family protein [bacterium]
METTSRVRDDSDSVRVTGPADQVTSGSPITRKQILSAVFFLLCAAVLATAASFDFLAQREPDLIRPAESLSRIGMLSDYFANLKGTSGDTPIYFFESGRPGATVLLLGGTHPNEPSGYVTATLVTENATVTSGRLLVIPQACASGFSCTDPFEGCPSSFSIQGQSGPRKFRFGSRVSNPLDQWPDPLVYLHYPSGQQLSGFESRNLNRSYPGRPDGTFTERVGYAIMQLIQQEKVDVAFDLHEAAPEIPIINAIVYHPKGEDVALMAVMNLEMADLRYSPELSPESFRGLSHREWGDRTEVMPFLMETSNPIQGRLRGKTDEQLILTGVSEEYKRALESGALRIEYLPEGEPLELRVGRHLQGFQSILGAYSDMYPDKSIVIDGLPSYDEVMSNGIGHYLH